MSTTPTAFVTTATGTQGDAVARQLCALGWAVRATARNPSQTAALSLRALGVNVTGGDWDDEAALKAAISGCSHLFLNLTPNFVTFSSEVPYAQRILSVARAAGVRHVVYSSVLFPTGAANEYSDPDSLPYKSVQWKREVESLVKQAGFETWAILRGGFFMANFLSPKVAMYPGFPKTNIWTTALTPDTRLPVVDHQDIAKFAVSAFQDPGRFHGQTIDVFGQLLTPEEAVGQLAAATGREMKARFLTGEEIEAQKATNIFIVAQLMMRGLGKGLDIDTVKSWGIPMGSFEQFLQREAKALKETYP